MNLFENKLFYIFCISMLPVVELRGGMPAAAAMGIPFLKAYVTCALGNLLPVPMLILFSKSVLTWLSKRKKIGPFFARMIDKANEKATTIGTQEWLGLCLFVAIPLPGTGAWTGSLVAAVLQMRAVKAFTAILTGVLISGVIMGFISYGAGFLISLF